MSKQNFAAATENNKNNNDILKGSAIIGVSLAAFIPAAFATAAFIARDPEPASKEITDQAVQSLLQRAHDPYFLSGTGHKFEQAGKIFISSVEDTGTNLCADYATIAFRPTLDDPFSNYNDQIADTKRVCVSFDSPEI